jgi:hypothetical protein
MKQILYSLALLAFYSFSYSQSDLIKTLNTENNYLENSGLYWQNQDPNSADPSFATNDSEMSVSISSNIATTFTIATPLCINGGVFVTANTGTVSVTGYTWTVMPAGGTIASPNASNTSLSFSGSGTYSVMLSVVSGTDSGSFTNTVQVTSTSIVVTTTASPPVICQPGTTNLSAWANNGGASFTWQPGGATTSNITGNSTMVGLNTYTVTVSTGTCIAMQTATYTVDDCTDIFGEEKNQFSFKVFPNPVHDKLFIDVNQPFANVNIEVIDALGKLVLKENHIGETKVSINVTHLPKGIYSLKVGSGEEVRLTRFVKE